MLVEGRHCLVKLVQCLRKVRSIARKRCPEEVGLGAELGTGRFGTRNGSVSTPNQIGSHVASIYASTTPTADELGLPIMDVFPRPSGRFATFPIAAALWAASICLGGALRLTAGKLWGTPVLSLFGRGNVPPLFWPPCRCQWSKQQISSRSSLIMMVKSDL